MTGKFQIVVNAVHFNFLNIVKQFTEVCNLITSNLYKIKDVNELFWLKFSNSHKNVLVLQITFCLEANVKNWS